jgi:hypothetical protein
VVGLERVAGSAYPLPMVDTAHGTEAPAEWLDALAESESRLAGGQTISGEAVRQELRDAMARLEAKRAAIPRDGATSRR